MAAVVIALVALSCGSGPASADDSLDAIHQQWAEIGTTQRLYLASDPYTPAVDASRPADPDRAAQLVALAERAAALNEAALALRLATEALHHDPDCEPARTVLGYTRSGQAWLTPYQLRMEQRGLVWHPEFAWIAPEDAKRYAKGERRLGRRWITQEIDQRRHESIASGWQVRTDNFIVTTNHSLEAGAHLAAQLEQLYQIWQQLFADFHTTGTQLRKRFEAGQVPGVRARPFSVIYHRSRDEYISHLRDRQPRIAETLGIYFDRQREAHFFFAPDLDTQATLYHEGVHQLFQESTRGVRGAGANDNFWLLEAAAVYFETLRPHKTPEGNYFTIGEMDAGRIPVARQRLLGEGYYVPLAELVPFGQQAYQQRDDLARLYGQSAALATFFMATPDRHRVFVEYLRRFYAGKTDPGTLSELTGKTYPELDTEFREFMAR